MIKTNQQQKTSKFLFAQRAESANKKWTSEVKTTKICAKLFMCIIELLPRYTT